MEIFYLSAPFAPDEQHTLEDHLDHVEDFAIQLAAPDRLIMTPHGMFPTAVETPETRETILAFQTALIEKGFFAEVVICGDRISTGMIREIYSAARFGVRLSRLETPAGKWRPFSLTEISHGHHCPICRAPTRPGMIYCSLQCSQVPEAVNP